MIKLLGAVGLKNLSNLVVKNGVHEILTGLIEHYAFPEDA